MLTDITFLTGSRMNTGYVYKNENLLKPGFRSPPGKDLHLTDFRDIRIIASSPFGLRSIVECSFTDGEQALAEVNYAALKVLEVFTYSKRNLKEGDSYDLPKKSEGLLANLFLAASVIFLYAVIKS